MPVSSTHNLPNQPLGDGFDLDSDLFREPPVDEKQPLLSEFLISGEDESVTEGGNGQGLVSKRTADTRLRFSNAGRARRPLRRSSSEQHSARRSQHLDSTTSSTPNPFGKRDADGGNKTSHPSDTRTSTLKHPAMRRTSSSSVVETSSLRREPAGGSGTLQQRLISRPKLTNKSRPKPWRVRRVRATSNPSIWPNSPSNARPGFKWFPVRSISDPSSVPQLKATSNHRGNDFPLKPCMKQKSKSTTTTPPRGRTMSPEDLPEGGQTLRRVKTVDFEETVSNKLRSLPLLKVWADEKSLITQTEPQKSKPRVEEDSPRTQKPVRPCPGPKMKSRPADTAITRTDVHVIAITPSWDVNDVSTGSKGESPTPTMQIVESRTGCYEVIWDNVILDRDIRSQRGTSSASHSLHAASSTATKGLERVNSKLTEWSWSNDAPSFTFQPQIVVFPDEDSRTPHSEYEVADDDLMICPPPNSLRTSANVSRYPSHPASVRLSRSSSQEEIDPDLDLATSVPNERCSSESEFHVAPHPDMSYIRPKDALLSGGLLSKAPYTDRKLSNIEDSEMKFRGHRDSVTLARSRIVNAGGASPELFTHRDTANMARKRLHGRNHAASNARDMSVSKMIASDPLPALAVSTSSPRLTRSSRVQ